MGRQGDDFRPLKELPGKLFLPRTGGPKKHPCAECFECQWCADARCAACRGACERCREQGLAGGEGAEG